MLVGWWQWGASVVGGGDGWQQLIAQVCGSWWCLWVFAVKNFKKYFLFQTNQKAQKITCLFIIFFYYILRGDGWVGQILNRKSYYFFFYFFNPSLIEKRLLRSFFLCITNLKCISEFFYRFVLFSVQLAGCDLHVSILPRGPYTAHVGSSLVFTCLRILNSSNSYGTIGLHQQYLYPIREILSSHCHCKMEIMVDTLERK